MIRRLMQQDLAWAGFVLLLAVVFGVGLQWQLVRLSWTGRLPAYLEAQREQRLQKEFQGIKTLNLAQAMAGIPTDRDLVVYCGMSSCEAALRAAEKLQSMGYSRVQVFMGGFRAWDDAGYPADISK